MVVIYISFADIALLQSSSIVEAINFNERDRLSLDESFCV